MDDPPHPTAVELEAGLALVQRSPNKLGSVELVVRRPAVEEREVLDVGQLDLDEGLIGDSWRLRPSSMTDDGGPHPGMQLNVMNARMASLAAGCDDRRALAGDQLFIDLDLSRTNLPAGTRLAVGTAVIEVTAVPHRGCAKFAARF